MNLAEYQTLTGITVSSANTAKVTAAIARTQSVLETLLGFTLDPTKVTENLYSELGKTSQECFCPSVNLENLNDPDPVVGAYRLFRYNDLDQYFHIDPFTKVHKVKLVYVKEGDTPNGVTLKTFDVDSIRAHYGQDGLAKYLEYCRDCLCTCDCTDCVQLAVDADWLWADASEIPADLNYVWADMITWYADPKNRNIRSESIDTHSYTRADNKPPQLYDENLAVIKRYAGPYGSVSAMPTTGAKAKR